MEMTLYEYRDLLNSLNSTAIDALQFYVSLLSAYLLVAYFVGRKLTRFQVIAVSVLYVFMISGPALTAMFTSIQSTEIAAEMYRTYGVAMAGIVEPSNDGGIFLLSLLIVGVIVSLVFMWSARRERAR